MLGKDALRAGTIPAIQAALSPPSSELAVSGIMMGLKLIVRAFFRQRELRQRLELVFARETMAFRNKLTWRDAEQ